MLALKLLKKHALFFHIAGAEDGGTKKISEFKRVKLIVFYS